MVGELESLKQFIPTGIGGQVMNVLTIGIIFIFIIAIAGVIAFFLVRNLQFNKRIKTFTKVGGRVQEGKNYRAKEIKYGSGGDTVFFVRGIKKYLPRPHLQIRTANGKIAYPFFIREDGEWINVEYGDWDAEMKTLGAFFVDKDMRYARTQIQRGIRDEHGEKPKFMEKYGGIIVPIVGIAIIMVFLYLMIDKIISVGDRLVAGVTASNAVMETSKEVISKLNSVLAGINNICTGSGYKPA